MTSIGQAHALPMHFYQNCRTSIFGLLSICSPTAIFREVSFAVIYSLNGMARCRLKSHIFDEQLKTAPSIANAYTSTDVVFGVMPSMVGASSSHSLPASVFTSAFIGRGMPMLSYHLNESLPAGAPTTFSKPGSEAAISDRFLFSAVASAYPPPSVGGPDRLPGYHNQPTEPLAYSVDHPHSNTLVSYALRLYKCPYCSTMLKHDDVHRHVQHICPRRPKK